MATQFSDLYGDNGVGFLVQDTSSASAADRKKAVNDAYVMLASIKGYWRKRSFDYTSSSSPALADGTYQYAVPTSPAYDSPYKLYYVYTGRPRIVQIVADDEWLERAKLATTDKGSPRFARIVQTDSGKQIELDQRLDAYFMNQIGTLTLEYFIEVTRLSADSDEPILPENYRHYIKFLAAKFYAIGQGDDALLRRLEVNGVLSMSERGFSALSRHDLTRTGRSQAIRPTNYYIPVHSGADDDYGEDS